MLGEHLGAPGPKGHQCPGQGTTRIPLDVEIGRGLNKSMLCSALHSEAASTGYEGIA